MAFAAGFSLIVAHCSMSIPLYRLIAQMYILLVSGMWVSITGS